MNRELVTIYETPPMKERHPRELTNALKGLHDLARKTTNLLFDVPTLASRLSATYPINQDTFLYEIPLVHASRSIKTVTGIEILTLYEIKNNEISKVFHIEQQQHGDKTMLCLLHTTNSAFTMFSLHNPAIQDILALPISQWFTQLSQINTQNNPWIYHEEFAKERAYSC